MNKPLLIALAPLALLLTGCPQNEYVVDLKPDGDSIQRTLTFYCQDGVDTNTGVPNYRNFPNDELKSITALYPPNAVTNAGDRHTASGAFKLLMPHDIGGAGYYSNLTTSLGTAALYTERFRGNDDLATPTEKRLRAADKLVDYVIGWSRVELGSQPHYADLRQFLDTGFRRDFKSLALYWWLGNIAANDRTDGGQEYAVRVGQFLVEHGYVDVGDLPVIGRAFEDGDADAAGRLVQRFVARKLKIPSARPMPAALAFLANADAMQKSWENYLATTPEYRQMLGKWRRQRLLATWLNPGYVARNLGGAFGSSVTNAPGPPKPTPDQVLDPVIEDLAEFELFPQPDGVKVNLELPSAPLHTNGKWDATNRKVTWEADIEKSGGLSPIPAFLFASWSQPNEDFQTAHFGKVRVSGDDLMAYCVWHTGLSPGRAREWDDFLAGLRPDDGWVEKLKGFSFTDEAAQKSTNSPAPSNFPRDLILNGWK